MIPIEHIIKQIQALKQKYDALILAHYYVDGAIQELADYVGDSYYLSYLVTTLPQEIIVFCGVSFMGESAKILSPKKTVLLPEPQATCPMASMADFEEIEKTKNEYDDLAVVCYVNSTAALKAQADVCVTSSNAVKIVDLLPQKNIYFLPDQNLGAYIAGKIPGKNFIFGSGHCYVHSGITADAVLKTKNKYPNAVVLSHPECTPEVLQMSDYVGSTTGIIRTAASDSSKEFIICTEVGVLYQLKKQNPEKNFHWVEPLAVCHDMKKITPDKVLLSLTDMIYPVEIDESLRQKAHKPLALMLEMTCKP